MVNLIPEQLFGAVCQLVGFCFISFTMLLAYLTAVRS